MIALGGGETRPLTCTSLAPSPTYRLEMILCGTTMVIHGMRIVNVENYLAAAVEDWRALAQLQPQPRREDRR